MLNLSQLIYGSQYLAVCVLMMFFAPEAVMPLAGHLSQNLSLNLVGVIVSGSLGATVGSFVIYMVSSIATPQQLARFIGRYGKWTGLTERRVTRATKRFEQNAAIAILLSRFVPGIRSAMCVPAGVTKMPLATFLGMTLLGNVIWISCLTYIGYVSAYHYDVIQRYISAGSWIVAGCVFIGLCAYAGSRWQGHKH